ncbi:MAG: response regulator, partial [Saprospiraceae bacterium]
SLPEKYGKHSLANIWGAFRLAKFAGYSLKLEKPSSLYFKFKDSFTNNEIVPNRNFLDGTLKTNCMALLIDDNAKSGWSDVLEYVLKRRIIRYDYSANLDVIDSYDAALELKDYEKYDIVFLDLRLLKDEDKGNSVIELEEFSGTKILRKIKKINRGIQVIIFSASNKIWYIDKLLNLKDANANGYYIKESPEYILSSNFSSENYKNLNDNIRKCLDLNFLKDFYKEFNLVKIELIKRRQRDLPKEFVDEVIRWLELSNDLIAKGATSLNITTSFLFYFSVIENISNNIIDVDTPILVETENGQKKYNFHFRGSGQFLRYYNEEILDSGIYRKTKGKLKSSRNIPWLLKILNTFDFISNYHIDEILVSNLIKKRNNIIHANTTTGDKINIELREIIMLYKYIIEGLKNIK